MELWDLRIFESHRVKMMMQYCDNVNFSDNDTDKKSCNVDSQNIRCVFSSYDFDIRFNDVF